MALTAEDNGTVQVRRATLAELERLREENLQLKQLLAPPKTTPAAWGLTGIEQTLFAHLATRELATHEGAMVALYGFEADREPKIIDVHICKMRKKLKAHGVRIETVHGQGYRLNDRRHWRAVLEGGETMATAMKTTPVTIQIDARAYPRMAERARALNYTVAHYAQLLCEAAYLARVSRERGEAVADRDLDRTVVSVFALAGAKPSEIAETLGLSAGLVARILKAWTEVAGTSSPARDVPAKPEAATRDAASGASAPAGNRTHPQEKPAATPTPTHGSAYKDADIETIRTMWRDGFTAVEIAAAIRRPVTGLRMWIQKHRDICPRRR